MIIKITLASILFLLAIITSCQNSDEYKVYAVKYWDAHNISAKQIRFLLPLMQSGFITISIICYRQPFAWTQNHR
jgi:hypothetical protein